MEGWFAMTGWYSRKRTPRYDVSPSARTTTTTTTLIHFFLDGVPLDTVGVSGSAVGIADPHWGQTFTASSQGVPHRWHCPAMFFTHLIQIVISSPSRGDAPYRRLLSHHASAPHMAHTLAPRTFSASCLRYRLSFARSSGRFPERILMARSDALVAPSIATVATGTPAGI